MLKILYHEKINCIQLLLRVCLDSTEQGRADNVKPCSQWPVCLCVPHSMWIWDLTIQVTSSHVTKKPNSVRSRFSKANSEVHTVSKIAVHMKTMNSLDCLGASKIKQKLLKCWVSSGGKWHKNLLFLRQFLGCTVQSFKIHFNIPYFIILL